MVQETEYLYVVRDDAILSGEPIIRGTRTPVRAIVETWRMGVAPEEIPRGMPHLTLGQVFGALTYYSDHQKEINSYIEQNHIPNELIDPLVRGFVNSLFICLYLDEDVDVLIAELLRARGFDAITARDAGQLNATDAEQFAYAVSQARTLITHNRTDFEELVQTYFNSGHLHYGVIFAVRRSPQEIAQRLLVILNQVTADEMQNQVRYI